MLFDHSPAYAEIEAFCISFAKMVRLKDFKNSEVLKFPFHKLVEIHFGSLVVGFEGYLTEILSEGFKVRLPIGFVFAIVTGENFIRLQNLRGIRDSVASEQRKALAKEIKDPQERSKLIFREIDHTDITVGAMIDIVDHLAFQTLYMKKQITSIEYGSVVGK